MKVLLALFVMIFFSACSMQEEVASSDSFGESIILERSGMYTLPEFGNQIYTLTQTNFSVKVYHYDGSLTKEVSFPLHPGITYSYFEKLESLNFTQLNDYYESSVPIADVGQGVVTYENHSILIAPYIGRGNPNEIQEVINLFNDLMNEVNMSEVFLIENSQEEEFSMFTYSYTGVQCIEESWQNWYSLGEINYIQEPTEEQLIIDYYASQGIEVELVEKIESNLMQCQACEVCSKGYSYEIQVGGKQSLLENEGWILKN